MDMTTNSNNGEAINMAMARVKPGTQVHHVMVHMLKKTTITQVEAHELYRVYRLASRINDLKNLGVVVIAAQVKDLTGRRYVRYSLA